VNVNSIFLPLDLPGMCFISGNQGLSVFNSGLSVEFLETIQHPST
jgi:hypothetical protein